MQSIGKPQGIPLCTFLNSVIKILRPAFQSPVLPVDLRSIPHPALGGPGLHRFVGMNAAHAQCWGEMRAAEHNYFDKLLKRIYIFFP